MTLENVFLTFAEVRDWESWLAKHHDDTDGVWLLIARKGSETPAITISDALDGALCYGWIDSQRKGRDEHSYLQRYSPRRAKSPWSKLNVERAKALIAAKRMRAPGQAEIAKAKRDGRWSAAYVSQRDVTLPEDFITALAAHPRAKAKFGQLSKTARYALLLPILKAITPTVRAARVKKTIASLTSDSRDVKRKS